MFKGRLTPQTPGTPTFSADPKTAKLPKRPSYFGGSADSPLRRRPVSSSLNNRHKYDEEMRTTYFMSSIKKSIKQNNIKFLIGERRVKLRTEPIADDRWIQKITHDALIDIRKRYDATRRQRIIKMQQTQILKERVKSFSVEQKFYRSKLSNGKQQSKCGDQNLTDQKMQVQYKQTDKKVLLHICDRLKQDLHFYKDKIIRYKHHLRSSQQNLYSLRTRNRTLTAQQKTTSNLLQKLAFSFEQQHKQRVEHINLFEQRINQKLQKQQCQLSRINYQQKQAQRALLAKDEQQNNWNLLFLSHLFVKKLLVRKMQRQMSKFQVIENAFIKIKSRTQIKSTPELIHKFLNRQQIYGQLLSELTRTKDHLNYLKLQQSSLLLQNTKLQQANREMSNYQYGRQTTSNLCTYLSIDPQQQFKGNEQIIWKSQNIDLDRIKLKQWILRQLLKFSRIDKRRYQFKAQYHDYGIKELFQKYLEVVNDSLDKIQSKAAMTMEEQTYEPTTIQPAINNTSAYFNQQIAIDTKSFISTHPKTKYEKLDRTGELSNNIYNTSNIYNTNTNMKNSKLYTNTDLKTSKLFISLDPQNLTVKQQLKQIDSEIYKAEEQAQSLNLLRQQIIQGNQKYMKDLRARFRQSKQKKV